MLTKRHRRLAGRRLSESLQQSHKVVIPVKRQSRYKCGSFACPRFPLIGFLAQIKFCLPVNYEDLCPLWKKHFKFFFLCVCFVFPYKVFSEASYNYRSEAESHSTRWLGVRAACCVSSAGRLFGSSTRVGVAVSGRRVQAAALVRSGSCSVAFKLIPRAFAAAA